MCETESFTIAHDILAYLVDNPAAEDTLEGIAEWWLLEQRAKQRIPQVKEAIAQLVADGLLLEQRGKDARIRYRVNRRRHRRIASVLKKRPSC